ncbi:cytochrome c [Sulfurimonas sp.]|uniref:c-type cytochrome n=1 Tax=Sulfurimonas sp. TaxID=2022749 RepID=UPI0035634B05
MRFFLLIFLTFLTLNADSVYEKGKNLYKEKGCGSCHGLKLEGMHRYPYLANRAKGFLTYKLKRFRSQNADNQQQEMMIPFAMNLSDEQIEALTTYMNKYVDESSNGRYDDSFYQEGDGGS